MSADHVEPHQAREVAESFGVDAARYDRARPRYPRELVDAVAAAGRDVLDVGCGTGIAARQFRAAGCRVLGVEPDERMARFARGSGIDVEVATFEAWDPAGRDFDAVVCGTAWHWVDPVAGAAKAAQVLRPGGRLALLWNHSRPPGPVVDALAAAYREAAPDSPIDLGADRTSADAYRPLFDQVIGTLREHGGFAGPEQRRLEQEHPCTRAAWLDQLPTQGALTRLSPDRLARVLDAVGAAIDALGGTITVRTTTSAILAERR